jgi:IS30 family transposase
MPGSRLSADDREEIAYRVRNGVSYAAIGRFLGRSTSTIQREVNRPGFYRGSVV